MPRESNEQTPLEVTRGMLVAIAVVMGIGWFGAKDGQQGRRPGERPGFAFGSWTGPRIRPILGQTIESAELGLQIDSVDGYVFFDVDQPDDGQAPSNISFINRSESILGEIKPFDPTNQIWPPQAIDFGQSVNIEIDGDPSADSAVIDVGPMSDFRMQVQTILYDEAKIVWASPRKSPAWPLRIHIGKCELGERTLLISVYEMDAKKPTPDYENGPIAAIAAALRPL